MHNLRFKGKKVTHSQKKEAYTNYLGDGDHLVAMAARSNRSKGTLGPEKWRASDEGYWCQGSVDWAEIKTGEADHDP